MTWRAQAELQARLNEAATTRLGAESTRSETRRNPADPRLDGSVSN